MPLFYTSLYEEMILTTENSSKLKMTQYSMYEENERKTLKRKARLFPFANN